MRLTCGVGMVLITASARNEFSSGAVTPVTRPFGVSTRATGVLQPATCRPARAIARASAWTSVSRAAFDVAELLLQAASGARCRRA